MNFKLITLLPLLFISLLSRAEKRDIALIPQPESIEMGSGVFSLSEETTIFIPREFSADLKPYITGKIESDLDLNISIKSGHRTPSSNFILFEKSKSEDIEEEGYHLKIVESKIVIEAKTYAGMFNAFQTLRQIIPLEKSSVVEIPCLEISDNPRFAWRGMMLDVSRHFQTKEFVKKQIDIFSSYKMNKFHWHLTDDQGWRIEIKKYPNLTEKGAWRGDRAGVDWWSRDFATTSEPKTVGGYYTQDDIKEVIEYARVRNVEIIPEIDVPAHSKALVASYPHLSCLDSLNFEVAVGGKAPDNALCAGKESTYSFLDDVLTEVAELFPSKYLHIGGDECNKGNWKKCEHCNKVVDEHDLKDMEELQSHFINRVHKLVTSKGKTMIGWDEILSGKGAEGATIMAWRRGKHTPEIDAPRGGHPTIMTDYTHSYISQVQGPMELEPKGPKVVLPLSKVYSYEPIPKELTAEEAKNILGTQACLWCEFTSTEEHCEYMLYPRALANAEVAWSRPEVKDWSRFQTSIESNVKRLERDGVNYSKSIYKIYASFALDRLHNIANTYLTTETVGYDIYYTTDGKEPSTKSNLYSGVFETKYKSSVKAGLFNSDGELVGDIIEVKIK